MKSLLKKIHVLNKEKKATIVSPKASDSRTAQDLQTNSMKFIYEIHKAMTGENLVLIYEGEFNQDIVKSVLALAEKNLEHIEEDHRVKRAVFMIMVECLQNICKHATVTSSGGMFDSIFMIGKHEDGYIINSGNMVENNCVRHLEHKLQHINMLDKEGLRLLYKELIKNVKVSERGGAGLGLVDMARKSGQKLEFNFDKVDEKYSFFSFMTKVKKINN